MKIKNKEEIKYIDCWLYIDKNDDLRIYYYDYTEQVLDFKGNEDFYDDLRYQISEDILNEYREKLKEKKFKWR